MGRRSIDAIPQQRLAAELRTAIDRSLYDKRAERTVEKLIRDNPTSSFSTHVLYNIGRARASYLFLFARRLDSGSRLVGEFAALTRGILVGPQRDR